MIILGPISMISGTLSGSYEVPMENKNRLSIGAVS